MFKKEYKKPVMKVVELESADIIATSGGDRHEEIDIDNTPHKGPWG